ncbi:MAG: YjhG/YagF family D-xylonate dehydratase [Bdellovibrionota bacterium]
MATPEYLNLSEPAYRVRTKAPGPAGSLPYTEEMLLHSPSGDLFGYSQNAGMGWNPALLQGEQVVILSTVGGLRAENGEAIALGYHTGHWELGLLVREAAQTLKAEGMLPFAVYCSDPCDGRSQGTTGMLDSLPYRNTAAEAFGRLVRSLPTRKGVIGIATCDKGLPAMMMALAESKDLAGILIPGGVTLPPIDGEDAGTVQSLGSRFAHGEVTLAQASALGCAACASSGGGCQFLGTAASSQVIGEALGLTLPHAALCPSGEEVWLELARSSARALGSFRNQQRTMADILTAGAFRNAMAVHAAFGGSTNLLLHLPAIAFSAGVTRPHVADWIEMNKRVPRIVDVLPNGPRNFRTVQVFLAGGVPEVMLRLRDIGALDLDCLTASGLTVGQVLDWWATSERRERFREHLRREDGVDPDEVILQPSQSDLRGLARTVIFPVGNLAPEGSVVKSTAIDPSLCKDGVYEQVGTARVFTSENAAIDAIRSVGEDRINPGDIIVLMCRGPLGAGMPETAQITLALKYTKALKHIALITDGRFSGFSSGPCVGHVGPEALAGGPIGKLRDGDIIRIRLDQNALEGAIDLVGDARTPDRDRSPEFGLQLLSARAPREDLKPDPQLPQATRLWAALQQSGGGTWGGCVYDVANIVERLR